MSDLEKELNSIIKQIKSLKKRKREIEKELIDSETNFIKKFKIWYENDSKCHHPWIITSPHLRELLNNKLYRHRTYTLEDLIGEDEFNLMVYPESCRMYYDSEEEFKRDYILTLSKFKPALEEAMNTKMKSFKCDW